MPGMLAMDHVGIYDALQAGTARNDATLAQALSEIGSETTRLMLSKAGNGIWTFANAWTIPTNVILEIPPGVQVTGAGQAVFNGGFLTYSYDTYSWHTRADAVSFFSTRPAFGASAIAFIYGIVGEAGTPSGLIHMRGNTSRPCNLMIEEGWDAGAGSHGGGAGISWKRLNIVRAFLGVEAGTVDLHLNLDASSSFIMNGGKVGIGISPTVQFELSGSVAQKATGTTWANPSDERIKTVQRPFTDGLALIQQFKTYWVKFNGLGGTDATHEEFVAPLAQEVRGYAPYMVGSYPAKLRPEDTDDTDILNFDGSTLMYALCNAVQEQQVMIEAQADLITAQQTALEALTARVEVLEAA